MFLNAARFQKFYILYLIDCKPFNIPDCIKTVDFFFKISIDVKHLYLPNNSYKNGKGEAFILKQGIIYLEILYLLCMLTLLLLRSETLHFSF